MFLKKFLNLQTIFKQDTILENADFKAYNTTQNKLDVTQFKYKSESAFKRAIKMADFKHKNIVKVISIAINERIITTEQLFPFLVACKDRNGIFDRHCAYILATVIDFLHKECKYSHNKICIESLFLTGNGNFVIGCFENCSQGGIEKDKIGFEKVIDRLELPFSKIESVIKDGMWQNSTYDNIENFFTSFLTMKFDDKRDEVANLKGLEERPNNFFSKKIIDLLISDLNSSMTDIPRREVEIYKRDLMEFIIELSDGDNKTLNDLFLILDPSVRATLLKSESLKKLESLKDKSVDCMLLGIKCKDTVLKKLTIDFLFDFYEKLTTTQKIKAIRSVQFIEKGSQLKKMHEILKRAEFNEQLANEIHLLIDIGLSSENNREITLDFLNSIYEKLDPKSISKTTLHIVADLLRCESAQKHAFLTILKLLSFLEKNGKKIIDKSWKIKNLKNIFGGEKEEKEDCFEKERDILVENKEKCVKSKEKVVQQKEKVIIMIDEAKGDKKLEEESDEWEDW